MTAVPEPSPLLRALAAAFEASAEAVGVQRDGALVVANRPLLTLFGWRSLDEAVGTLLLDRVAPESRAALAEQTARRRRGEPVASPFQVVGLRVDGTTFQLELRGATVDLDGVPHVLAFLRDVTEQHHAEATRRDREALYKAVFEVNAAIKLLIDPADGHIVDANPAAAQFYGWSLDELRTMKITDINTLTRAEVEAEMERARSRRQTSFRFRHLTRGGAIADVEVHSGPIVLEGKTLLLSIIHDVTERNRFEEQLRHAHRLEAIGRLAAGIAHDFNNLLTVISASVQLAGRHTSPERIGPYLADVRAATQRGADLTRHLLALGREQTLTPAVVDLERMLGNMAELLQRVLGDAITVTCQVADGLPPASVDPGQLELVLINMALNARDAMPGGGRLTFGAALPDDPPPGLEDADLIALTVTDDGTGMDEATRARVFEPFFTTKPAGVGSGLGLAVAFGVAAQSGGTLTVDSEPGAGTRFTLYLPIAQASVEEVEAGAAVDVPFAGSMVLVDDKPEVRDALARLLAELGFVVHAAAGAREALALLAALPTPVDLVLSDVAMPGRSGIELVADIAAGWPGLPVVLMSGHAAPTTHPSTAAAFLAKPFSLEQLATALRAVAPACVRDA